MIHSAPKVVRLAIDLHEHLVEVPFPVPKAPHPRAALATNIGREKRTEPVPPQSHSFVADVDPALEEQILHVP